MRIDELGAIMLTEKACTLNIANSKRLLRTDNCATYFTISDNLDTFDGLWSHGFHIFNRLIINNMTLLNKKKVTPFKCVLYYQKAIKSLLMLFKNDQGLLFETSKNSLSASRRVNYKMIISGHFRFLKLENNILYLEYTSPQREGFGIEKLYVGISSESEFFLENVVENENLLEFDLLQKMKTKKRPAIFFFYSGNLETLTNTISMNLGKLDVLIKQHIGNSLLPLKYSDSKTGSNAFNKALTYSILVGASFIMSKNGMIGLWAGYPWFDNSWGRDTFIALPGIAFVTGRFEQAAHIIGNFLKYQDTDSSSSTYGRIPNVILDEKHIQYNTGDATPLFIRELYEYFLYTGDVTTIMSMWNNIILAIDSVYMAKKDENNFICNDDADDWMDARIAGKEAYSPRGDKQVEIQVLWFVALHVVINIADEIVKRSENYKPVVENIDMEKLKQKRNQYQIEADKLLRSFREYFITSDPPYIYDHLNCDGTPDLKVRPNVLLAIYYNDLVNIPRLIDRNCGLMAFKYVVKQNVFEHGVASLSKEDEDFHPVHITKSYHKDAAYHNGMIWGWLSGPFVHVAAQYGLENFAFKHTKLLSNEILNGATPGSLSELFDPLRIDGAVHSSGTYSQAWSISEFTRAFYQDYMGIRPDLPHRKLYFYPRYPVELDDFKANIRYGLYETLSIYTKMDKKKRNVSYIELFSLNITKPLEIIIRINIGRENRNGEFESKVTYFRVLLKSPGAKVKIDFELVESNRIKLKDLFISNKADLLSMKTESEIFKEAPDLNLTYAADITELELTSFQSITEKDYLEQKILGSRAGI